MQPPGETADTETPEELEFLRWVLRGDAEAVAFVQALAFVSQVWDDVVDGDKEVTTSQVNTAFHAALVDIPRNVFFLNNLESLTTVMQVVMQDWMDATRLQSGSRTDITVAYVLRDSMTALVIYCARLVGGAEWAAKVGPVVRRYVHDEPLDVFMEEHNVHFRQCAKTEG